MKIRYAHWPRHDQNKHWMLKTFDYLFNFDFKTYSSQTKPRDGVDIQKLPPHKRPPTKDQLELQRAKHVLPWIADPFDRSLEQKVKKQQQHDHDAASVAPSATPPTRTGTHLSVTPVTRPDESSNAEQQQNDSSEVLEKVQERNGELPIQLLYDLFFVANLSAITSDKDFYDPKTLITYTLFFAILWFTWMQVTYHDLRYSRDSFYERVCKMAQFSFMILFSAKSREWNPYEMDKKPSQDAVIWVSAVLMASRWFLMVQYGVVAYFLWRKNRRELKVKPEGYIKYDDPNYEAVRHVLFHAAVMFVMSLVYMIIFLVFKQTPEKAKYYWIWFVLLPLESLFVVGVSLNFNSTDFENGILVQRMSTLTLIVLGEGVIVLMKAVETVSNAETSWHAKFGCTVISALIGIYIIWMYYFDYIPGPKVIETSFQQHVWSVVHFPLHVALIVYAEATRQFVVLWSFNDHFDELSEAVPVLEAVTKDGAEIDPKPMTVEAVEKLDKWFTSLEQTRRAYSVLSFLDDDRKRFKDWNTTDTADMTVHALNYHHRKILAPVFWDVLSGYMQLFSLRSPDETIYVRPTGDQVLEVNTEDHMSIHGVFVPKIFEEAMIVIFFVFRTMVIALGVVFLCFAVLAFLVRGRHDPYDLVNISTRLLCATIFLSLIAVTGTFSHPRDTTLKFMREGAGQVVESEYLGILLCVIMASALLIGKIVDYYAYRRVSGKPKDTENTPVGSVASTGSTGSVVPNKPLVVSTIPEAHLTPLSQLQTRPAVAEIQPTQIPSAVSEVSRTQTPPDAVLQAPQPETATQTSPRVTPTEKPATTEIPHQTQSPESGSGTGPGQGCVV